MTYEALELYETIQSPHIRKRVAALSFNQREIVQDLVKLQKFVTETPKGMAGQWLFDTLRKHYSNDWLALCLEHSEERYEQELAKMTAQEQAREESLRAEAETLQRERFAWQRLKKDVAG